MSQIGVKFIIKAITWTACASACWIATLCHEVCNYAVKDRIVIKSLAGQKDKIVDGNRSLVCMEVDLDISFFGMQGCGEFLNWVNQHSWGRRPLHRMIRHLFASLLISA
jgi:hypothetical protein